jgi:uncharacterized phage protein (TIGR02218 family)
LLEAGEVRIHRGFLGEPTVAPPVATLQFTGLSQKLNQPIGDLYCPTCRVRRFGDSQCKAPLTPYTHVGTVIGVMDSQRFTTSVVVADNLLYKGWISFQTGDNVGLEEEISTNTGGSIVLFAPMFGTVNVGDEITIVEGCDRSPARCQQIVNIDNPSGFNMENFRGEDKLPGRTKVFNYPS